MLQRILQSIFCLLFMLKERNVNMGEQNVPIGYYRKNCNYPSGVINIQNDQLIPFSTDRLHKCFKKFQIFFCSIPIIIRFLAILKNHV